MACALAAAATPALVFPAEAAGPPKSLKVCVQTRGSRENVGDLNSRGTLCGRGARLTLPIEPVIGKRGPVGPPGPKGDRGPVGESAPHGWIDVIALVLELTGLFLLASEVYRAQQAERIHHELAQTRQLQFLYTTGAYRDFYLATRLSKGRTPQQAQDDARELDERAGTTAAAAEGYEMLARNDWDWLADHASRGLERWDGPTASGSFKWRRRRLLGGSVLLASAAVLHLFA